MPLSSRSPDAAAATKSCTGSRRFPPVHAYLSGMLTISLNNLVFTAYHGVYEAEKVLGNRFTINAELRFLPAVPIIAQLDETVNYEAVFNVINKRMQHSTPLLETIVMELCRDILQDFIQVQWVKITLEKQAPPIPKLSGSVQVGYEMARQAEF